jgi:hypothetical protein
MTSLLQTLREKPMLIAELDGLIIAEPLRFISLKSIAATRRHLVRRNYESLAKAQLVHADLTTQDRGQHHGA